MSDWFYFDFYQYLIEVSPANRALIIIWIPINELKNTSNLMWHELVNIWFFRNLMEIVSNVRLKLHYSGLLFLSYKRDRSRINSSRVTNKSLKLEQIAREFSCTY